MQRNSRNENDRFTASAESHQSSEAARSPRGYHCITLNEDGPRTVRTSTPDDVLGQSPNNDPEDSTLGRGLPLPRWDGVGVWVPNTIRRAGQRQPVQRHQTFEEPSSQSDTPSSPPTTMTTSASLSRQSHRAKLFRVASSKLASVWNRRPTKLRWKFSSFRSTTANGATSTTQQPVRQQDQKSATLTVCQKCHGITVKDASFNRPVAAEPAASTNNVWTGFTSPDVTLATVRRDLETESGYLIGRAASNSPNDVISCRTLPSTSPDDVNEGEDNKHYATDGERVEDDDVPCSAAGPPSDRDVVGDPKDAQSQDDLLSWKLSLMDRTEGRLMTATPGSWVHGSDTSSDEADADDERERRRAQKTPHDAVMEKHSCAESSPNKLFRFENDFERALEEPTTTAPGNVRDSRDKAAAEDVEKLFDAKLDELLRTNCDVTGGGPPFLNNGKNPLSEDDNATYRTSEFTCKPTDGCSKMPPTTVTDSLHSSVAAECRRSSSLPTRSYASTRVRTIAAVVHKSFDSADVDSSAARRSALIAPVPPCRDDEDSNNLQNNVGSLDGQGEAKSVLAAAAGRPLPKNGEPSQTERQPHEPSLIQTESSYRRHHCDVTFSSTDDGEDFDNERRTIAWRRLRRAVDDGVVELIDDLVTMMMRGSATTSDLRRADVERLRRRLLRNVRTALWTGSGKTSCAKDDNNDELRRLRRFTHALLDCADEDDIYRVADIKKYVMTCPSLQAGCSSDDVECSGMQRQRRTDAREIRVFVLRHGISIDGMHVSVAGHNDLPVHVTQDSRE